MRLHHLVPTLSPRDAIGSLVVAFRELLQRLGFESEIFATHIHPELRSSARPSADLASVIRPEDGVIYHHGIGSEEVALFASLHCRKLLAYYDVTPAEFYRPYDPAMADALAEGRLQLLLLQRQVELAICLSDYSAGELRALGFTRVAVVPPPLRFDRVCGTPDERLLAKLSDGSTNLLFVGRISPHKRVEDLIELTRLLQQRSPARRWRLVLAGGAPRESAYVRLLHQRASGLGPPVLFLGAVSETELGACYLGAQLFVSMSEHEGFGLPLCEAMAADVPVLAFAAGAVPETLGGAGLLFSPKSLPHIAALCETLVGSESLRERLLEGQRRRVGRLGPDVTLPILRDTLQPLFGTGTLDPGPVPEAR
jgi:glycosyltransferase involved in cell wall biosynthesis